MSTTEKWPALERGDLIVVSDSTSPGRGDEIGLVLEDTLEGRPPRFLNLGGTNLTSAMVIGAISVADRDQQVRRLLDRKAAAPRMKWLAENLGPLVGRTFPELWDGGGR